MRTLFDSGDAKAFNAAAEGLKIEKDASVCKEVAAHLRDSKQPNTISVLRSLIMSRDESVAKKALESVLYRGWRPVSEADEELRLRALELLLDSGDPNAGSILNETISSERSAWVCKTIARRLGYTRIPEGSSILISLLQHSDKGVAKQALDSLISNRWRTADPKLLNTISILYQSILNECHKRAPTRTPGASVAKDYWGMIDLIDKIDPAFISIDLRNFLANVGICQVISRIKSDMLGNMFYELPREASEALVRVFVKIGPEGIPTLISELTSHVNEPESRAERDIIWTIRETLKSFGSKATPHLMSSLIGSVSGETRRTGVGVILEVLISVGGVSSDLVPVLKQIAVKIPTVRHPVCEALQAVGGSAAIEALSAMFEERPNKEVASTIGKIGGPEAIAALLKLNDRSPDEAMWGLAAAGHAAVVPQILTFVSRCESRLAKSTGYLGLHGDEENWSFTWGIRLREASKFLSDLTAKSCQSMSAEALQEMISLQDRKISYSQYYGTEGGTELRYDAQELECSFAEARRLAADELRRRGVRR
jgi:HEAT repeat protein